MSWVLWVEGRGVLAVMRPIAAGVGVKGTAFGVELESLRRLVDVLIGVL